jgi:hypothetical protein
LGGGGETLKWGTRRRGGGFYKKGNEKEKIEVKRLNQFKKGKIKAIRVCERQIFAYLGRGKNIIRRGVNSFLTCNGLKI